MNFSLEGKRALVCGATQGIGRACAQELALLGAEVIVMARREDALIQVAAALPKPNGQVHGYLVADFAHPEQVGAAVAALDRPVHILVHNTGGPKAGTALDADPQAYAQAFAMHLLSGQQLVQALVPGMKAEGYGRILNVISTSVKVPIPGLGVSNTIRAAVASWAKTLSRELAPYGITVNNVLPGYTRTARLQSLMETRAHEQQMDVEEYAEQLAMSLPPRRFAEPEEVAAAVVFLAGPAASYINGINLPVDGGNTPSL